ncbi:Arm repeat protein interacting with ABF2 [Glycine soja]|uniref:Arm repeat protein interacting with ABF2 n=1 Tax=Glycine soja TaxID=3848 RepID=A0A445F539_GLYSO|nr:Arm repeat protein interacting with ABF2 [Glycine soja]
MEEEEDDSMVAKCPASLYVMSPAGKEWWHICTVWRLEERRKGRQKKDNEQKGPLGTEKEARDIEIPNIRWEIFELMMRFVYCGSVDVTLDIALDLLRAANQYLLEGLKRLCEYTIAQDISPENVSSMYELSEAFNAISLRHACILFILEQFDKLSSRPGHSLLIQRIIPEIRNYFVKALTKANSHDNRL